MSFFQREAAVVNVVEKEKPKDKKASSKKPTGVKKPVQKKSEKDEQEKTISQKNFTEEIDIKELATMQGKIEKPVVRKEEKKEEKKTEVKEAPKEVVAAVDSKKKQKKSDWVTKEVKPQRVKPEETEEKKEEEKKPEKKGGDKRGDKKRGDKKGGDKKRGDKKEEEGEPKEKSIYKAFKPHGAEADKVEAKEEKKEETEKVEEEKKEKKEKKEKSEKTQPQKPRLKMKYNAYKSSEDFWETNIADSYVEPAEITTVSPVPTEEKAEKKEKKEKGAPKKGESREPAPAVQIKVNKQVSLARTDPWAKTDSSAQATTSDSDDYFPALGEKNVQKKPKKVNKASETETTVASPQKKSESHKREANDTLFYNAEAPADKKIKLGEEAEKEEGFVLPSE